MFVGPAIIIAPGYTTQNTGMWLYIFSLLCRERWSCHGRLWPESCDLNTKGKEWSSAAQRINDREALKSKKTFSRMFHFQSFVELRCIG